jgi:hypothetical protein
MGGTVYADSAGTTPAAQVEVRVNNPDGTSVRAYTDAAGNFYLPTGSGNLATGAKVGMRTASGSHIMKGPATGDCNGCHRAGGSPGVLHF